MHFPSIRKYSFYLLFFILLYWALWLFDTPLGYLYDLVSQQFPIESEEAIDQQFDSFELVTYADLPDRKKISLASDEAKVCYAVKKTEFYSDQLFLKISWFDRYKFLVADYRVLDFLSGSHLFSNSSGFPHFDKTQYLPIDKKILYKILQLKIELDKQDYLGDQFMINSGFRTPFYNEAVGGKICSRHQFGDAVDIRVYDVNDDQVADAKDAKIVYDLLNQSIIRNEGGLGKYKSDSNVLHFDTRGRRARWHY